MCPIFPQTTATFTNAATGGVLARHHTDAGPQSRLHDALGRPWFNADARGFVGTRSYDAMHRLTATAVARRSDPSCVASCRIGHGESLLLTAGQALNLRGRVCERFDQAGWTSLKGMYIEGSPGASLLLLGKPYQPGADGMPAINVPPLEAGRPASALLQTQGFSAACQRIDALSRYLEIVNVDGGTSRYRFLRLGRLQALEVDGRPCMDGAVYDARLQLRTVSNGANDAGEALYATTYEYDARDHRCRRIHAAAFISGAYDKSAQQGRRCEEPSTGACRQDSRRLFDPLGNVAAVTDAFPSVARGTTGAATASGDFVYDALYRLIAGSGVEAPPARLDDGRSGTNVLPLAGLSRLTPYRLYFRYDDNGNIVTVMHAGAASNTRIDMAVSADSNRSIATALLWESGCATGTVPDNAALAENGFFDACGNQLSAEGVHSISWDYRNQLSMASYPDPGDPCNTVTEYMVQGQDGGNRTRKITTITNADGLVVELRTVAYLGDVELRSSYQQSDVGLGIDYDGETVANSTLLSSYAEFRVRFDGAQRMRVLRSWSEGKPRESGGSRRYYVLSDHLGSCRTELDDQGRVANCQAFYPYGATSFLATDDAGPCASLSSKQVQFSGQERDDSGLYYYGYRYFDTTASRWTRPDPAGFAGSGLNWYQMVDGNPLTCRDVLGLGKWKSLFGCFGRGRADAGEKEMAEIVQPASNRPVLQHLQQSISLHATLPVQRAGRAGKERIIAAYPVTDPSAFPEEIRSLVGAIDLLRTEPHAFLRKYAFVSKQGGNAGSRAFYLFDANEGNQQPEDQRDLCITATDQLMMVPADVKHIVEVDNVIGIPMRTRGRETALGIDAYQPARLLNEEGGAFLAVTPRLSGCSMVVRPASQAWEVAHVRPLQASAAAGYAGETGEELEIGLRKANPGAAVFGKSRYRQGMAHFIGVMRDGQWTFYTQELTSRFRIGEVGRLQAPEASSELEWVSIV